MKFNALICLLLCSCSSNWHGVGVSRTDIVDAGFSKVMECESFGIGILTMDSNAWSFTCGYNDTYIRTYDVQKIIDIRKREKILVDLKNHGE